MSLAITGTGPVGSKIANAQGYVNDKVRALVAPKSSKGIGGFEFDIPESEQITLSSEITDNVVESGSFISDHVINKPVRIVLSGFVGELVDAPPTGVDGSIQALRGTVDGAGSFVGSLPFVGEYLGDYADGMVQAINGAIDVVEEAVGKINEIINTVDNVVGLFVGGEPKPSRQAQAFIDLKALWDSKQIITVHTPWQYFEDMIIESISFNQSSESNKISDISVTVKEVRFAEVEKVAFDDNLFPVRSEIQEAPEQDQGTVEGTRNSLAFDAFTALGG